KPRHHTPPRERLARRRESRLDLGGVVRVVVHHHHASHFTHPLEAPPHSGEFRERRERPLEVRPQLVHHRERRGRIAHVVESRHAQPQREYTTVWQLDPRRRAPLIQLYVGNPHVRVSAKPHVPYGRAHGRHHSQRARVVSARDHAPGPARELRERLLQRRHAAVVALEVRSEERRVGKEWRSGWPLYTAH